MYKIPFHTISRLIFFGAWNRIRYHQYSRRFHVVASALASEKSSHLGANPGEEKFVNSIRALLPSTNQRRQDRQGLRYSRNMRSRRASFSLTSASIRAHDYSAVGNLVWRLFLILRTFADVKTFKRHTLHYLLSYRFPFARECEIKPVASMRIRIAEAILYENV